MLECLETLKKNMYIGYSQPSLNFRNALSTSIALNKVSLTKIKCDVKPTISGERG